MVWVEGIRRNKTSKFSPGSPTEPTWVPAWVPAPCDQLAEGVGRCGGGGTQPPEAQAIGTQIQL